ncbi:hypothetical protein Tco_0715214 [Tanacetum coccineum]
MEEYTRLEEAKSRRNAIVFDDTLIYQAALSCKPMISPLNDNEIDFRISFDESDDEDYTGKLVSKNGYDVLDMALLPRDQKHQYLRSEGLEYTDANITDFEDRFGRI